MNYHPQQQITFFDIQKRENKKTKRIKSENNDLLKNIDSLPFFEKVNVLNRIQRQISKESPFRDEPITQVLWVPISKVRSNDYNPNSVAPPEMELLALSICHDGYTQPVVVWYDEEKDMYEVVDGFHRFRVAKEHPEVSKRLNGYLPVTVIKDKSVDRNNRIAATVRHNRARGKHSVERMSEIVIELKKRNWSDNRISKELGMDADEVLRLCQVSGLTEVFSNEEFSEAWDVGIFDDNDLEIISEDDL